MKIQWFLRGLGVGIIITALLLCITYRGSQKNNNIIRQAKELGMVFPENETGDVSVSAEELAQQMAKDNANAVSGTSVHVPSEEEKKAKDKLDKSSQDITKASKYQGETKNFVVRSGLLSSSVAREMEAAGVIDDADAFDEFVEKNGYGKMIRSGKYKIPEGADYETIAKIITRQD